MHAGFAMLETGSVTKTSVADIMFTNVSTISIGVIFYWFFGYGFAYGSSEGASKFIGTRSFMGRFPNKEFDKALWFFQMVFAAAAATIVSGAVAGRIKLSAYFVVAGLLTALVCPVVTHWIWATGGCLSAFTPVEVLFTLIGQKEPCEMVDFAGSGVVHMIGGVAAFWGAFILGTRENWSPGAYPPYNYPLATLGTFILWFAWNGVNAGHVTITTTFSSAASCIMG